MEETLLRTAGAVGKGDDKSSTVNTEFTPQLVAVALSDEAPGRTLVVAETGGEQLHVLDCSKEGCAACTASLPYS